MFQCVYFQVPKGSVFNLYSPQLIGLDSFSAQLNNDQVFVFEGYFFVLLESASLLVLLQHFSISLDAYVLNFANQ